MKAVFEIKSGNMLAGEIPKNAKKLVVSWTRKNRAILIANWKRAEHHEELIRIPGEE